MMDELKADGVNPVDPVGSAEDGPGLKPSNDEALSPGLKPGASTLSSDSTRGESGSSDQQMPGEHPAKVPPSPSERMGHPGVESLGSVEALAPSASSTTRQKPERTEKDKREESASPFSVTVSMVYDGPLDLLLDLIRKQDIDIYDIPIAKITAQ